MMVPFPRLTTHPSLGQLTVVPATQDVIRFTVLTEWNEANLQDTLELELCYILSSNADTHESSWNTLPLTNTDDPSIVRQTKTFRSTFHNVQPKESLISGFDHAIRFTVKYRTSTTAPWQWVTHEQEIQAGELVFQSSALSLEKDISDFVSLGSGWVATKLPGTQVYLLKSQSLIPKSNVAEDEEKLSTQILGRVPGHLQYLALVRHDPYWLVPRHGKDHFHLTKDAVLCSFLTKTGRIVTILTFAESDNTYSVFQSNERGEIVVAARCDSENDNHFCAAISVSDNFEDACTATMKLASDIANSHIVHKKQDTMIPEKSSESDAIFENWLDGLAFCTWNALGQDLTEDKILSALSSLSDNKINISVLLIDDGWQTLGPIPDLDYSEPFFRGMSELACRPEVAPEGLAALVQKIKSAHPKIADIGVWHALMGYWGGISPSGQIAKDYDTIEIPTYLMNNTPAMMTSIAASSLHKFYDDFYAYLSKSGVTFIKTDVQHMITMFRTWSARHDLTEQYQLAWTLAHNRYFSSKAISCMSQTPQTLYTSLMQTVTPRVLLRNSDDFFPEDPASHPWHIWVNAHNALFTRHLNVRPDWDMFQTSHSFSSYHAAARCISGGPILITDVPGQHDVSLIQQMTALDQNGRSIALRPGMARTLRVFDDYVEGNILRIGSVTNEDRASSDDRPQWRASLLGLWNIADQEKSTMLAVKDFVDIDLLGQEVVIGSFRSQKIFGPFRTQASPGDGAHGAVDAKDLLYASVPIHEWEMLTAYPVLRPLTGREGGAVAVMGLRDKISGAAGVLAVTTSTSADEKALTVHIRLKALGVLGLWTIGIPDKALSHTTLKLQGDAIGGEHVKVEMLVDANGDKEQRLMSLDLEEDWRAKKLFETRKNGIVVDLELGFE